MTLTHPPPRRARPFALLVARLRRLIRAHENDSIRLVIATHVIMVTLDLIDRATFQSVAVPYRMLEVFSESPLWILLGAACGAWLLIWRTPPRVIIGLWVSTATLAGWGLVNFAVGIVASHPVSLLGPSLILGVAAPLAWTTADALQERMTQDRANAAQNAAAVRRTEKG